MLKIGNLKDNVKRLSKMLNKDRSIDKPQKQPIEGAGALCPFCNEKQLLKFNNGKPKSTCGDELCKRKYVSAYNKKRRLDPEYIKRVKGYNARYVERNKDNPEYKKRLKALYQKQRTKPEYKERMRAYYLKYKLKKEEAKKALNQEPKGTTSNQPL